jgi:hypothetical protein
LSKSVGVNNTEYYQCKLWTLVNNNSLILIYQLLANVLH